MIIKNMPLFSLLTYVGTAAFYYYFNSQMFQFFSLFTGKKLPTWKCKILTFAVNYMIFILVSFFKLYLILNWTIFALFLILEIALLYHSNAKMSIFCGLQGALVGLSINFITRSSAAIFSRLPMMAFDSVRKNPMNYKSYPIAAGFLLAGLFFYLLRKRFRDWQEDQSESGRISNLSFSTWLVIALFLYLDLNLLIYFVPYDENSIILKLWAMKSGICTLAGYTIGIYHTYTLARLRNFELRSQMIREELQGFQAKEEELVQYASYDGLTGCCVRSTGVQAIDQAYAIGQSFCICFIDVNDLKQVNDTLGHDAGDRYLAAVAHVVTQAANLEMGDIICRYGGDEFLLITLSVDEQTLQLRMRNATLSLEELSNTSEYPFRLWMSCGIASSGEGKDAMTLIHLADKRMYENKKRDKNL